MYQAQVDFMQARFYHGETPTPNVSYPWQDTLTAQVCGLKAHPCDVAARL